ncbi:DNA polymerase III delta subunit [Nicoletella semolina]|uniref:DNA polymerase III subunit delta n=1 Tax=Nicoletella semolina TaxID=271160 RepID=A0A4R2N9Z3_9PAST|nr:DNA polymerase III subunit delta [Nicoletella semolina]MDH2925333.1 DNA polymerase III subunit delta [Nicoletella semolina]TCP17810.1 DNA polymerase III delta subunit [Nicoletella semolina]
MQRIFPEAIEFALEKGLQPFYLLTGQDLLLVDETKSKILQKAFSSGFDEKNDVVIVNDTKWDQLFEQVQSNGLFFNRQALLLNLPDSITVSQQKNLAELLAYSSPDLLFILHLPKFTKQVEKQSWFSQISQNTVQVNCQTPDITKLSAWIAHRAQSMNLHIELEAIQFLSHNYEGNLLALKQTLQMLKLSFNNGKITLPRAKEIVEQSAQFTPFQWVDALLEGKIHRAIRILAQLQQEDIQPVVLLRIVQKELFLLLEITRSPQKATAHQLLFSGNLRGEFDRLKVWQTRRMLYQQAVSRLTYQKLYQLIQSLAKLEKSIKQAFDEDIWLFLARFCTQFGQ